MILGLFSEALSAGGIQRVALHTGAALQRIADDARTATIFLSLNDPIGQHEVRVDDTPIRIRGYDRSKRHFALGAIEYSAGCGDVYINHLGLAPVGAAIRLRHPSARVWVHLHGIEAWAPLSAPRRALLRAVTGFFAISEFTADRAANVQGIAREKIRVLPNALDPELLRRTAMPGTRDSAAPTLLTVARLAASEKYKGADTVLRALPELRARFGDLSYVIIGDGDDRPRLERLAHELGVSDLVDFRGRVSEHDLVDAYRNADVFVMPSRGEGLGVVYLEAMAFGLPVIGGRHGGAPEVVREGETGYLVEHDDAAGIAEHVTRLLSDSDLAARMGAAGRKRVEEEYTFEHFVRRLRLELARGRRA